MIPSSHAMPIVQALVLYMNTASCKVGNEPIRPREYTSAITYKHKKRHDSLGPYYNPRYVFMSSHLPRLNIPLTWIAFAVSRVIILRYRIEDGVSSGETLNFTINANYVTSFFEGTKSLVVSTTNSMGGQNPYWGQSLVTLGIAIWVLAALGAVRCFHGSVPTTF